jgi:thiosulfate reductase cytochrome b subunit
MPDAPRHTAWVRITHWVTVLCFAALLVSGIEILISHPRFYWGETGNVMTQPLFIIPVPASRSTVPTGYGFVLPDQNGWSRYLHFQSAWAMVITGLVYLIAGMVMRHFRDHLIPARSDASRGYNRNQRLAYLCVIFILFPLMIWTGLAMSPAFTSAFPLAVEALGGRQSARTLHFFASLSLVTFVAGHIAMVALSGFGLQMRGMIFGRSPEGRTHD